MPFFRSDPFLWIHMAGVAALPIFLELCLVGLAVGEPLLPVWLELFIVAAIAILPVLWMQWFRPFYIFSILIVAMKPQQLSPEQRQILRLFQQPRNRLLALSVSIFMVAILWNLYRWAPIASGIAAQLPQWRIAGLAIASAAFLSSNLFLQVPVSVLGVTLRSESTFAATEPIPLEQIPQNFTILGLKVTRILPPTENEVQLTPANPVSTVVSPEPNSVEIKESNVEVSD